MYDNRWQFLSLYDGTCDQTKELKTLSGKMTDDQKWVISSSGHHIFVSFNVDNVNSMPGFFANIYYGNKIKNIQIVCIKKT